ncbi:pyruvate carboxylase [Daldinia decipiens]|uniref:pyruvate carboxylase n=1 Tax=Daldinia decipiens TaxID=326647 RepID=UPI0020C3A4FD|nr:pyruvate carboxylase [Daldinia decipiens]KAI1654776.1 pyruvate carboxylase [Daldinia decipiens]
MTFLPHDKILIANRGEIAVRIARAARELSLPSIAIYAHEDRYSDHYRAADEAYLLGEAGELGPRAAYLDIDRILQIAKKHGATLIHPGYGFLAEDSNFARAIEEAGLTFIGPPADVLDGFGNKISARKLATECDVPTIPGLNHAVSELSEIEDFISKHGFPVIIKASHGGGGRGQRILYGDPSEDIANILSEARSEAKDSFGVDAVFVEKFLPSPKHIEVQILADKHGNVAHLLERDCTIQRKHQKIVEFAPAVSVSKETRQKMHDAAVRLSKYVKYENAATVEFLVQGDEFYFIEVNPRIQVEHTVTEQILNVDLVQAQIRIARGASLTDPLLGIDLAPETRSVAIQCRITSEQPSLGFVPSCGTITHAQLPGGPGVRIDGYNLFAGAEVTPHYDPLLFKCIVQANDLQHASAKMLGALNATQIAGVETNIDLLRRILEDPRFVKQQFFTRSLDSDVILTKPSEQNEDPSDQKLISFFAESLINGTQIQGQIGKPESLREIELPILKESNSRKLLHNNVRHSDGWRSVLLAEGPKAFAQQVRRHPRVLLSDTTWRDAQQSLLATRIRTVDFAKIAPATNVAYRQAYSLECWGGATFDVALRFLHEDPWKRLATLRKLVPDVPFQMLLRSVSGLAYSAVPHNFLEYFASQAVENGIDIIRVFDGLNDVANLTVAIDACLRAGAVVEAAILYTGDMLDPDCKYSLNYYIGLIDSLVTTGAHIIAIKSMSGVMKPEAARLLVGAIRSRHPFLPIHVHTHDAAGTGVATMLACVEAGADIIDGATDSMSGTTAQPAMSALIASLMGRKDEGELDLDHVRAVDSYWAQLRLLYAGFDAKISGPDPDVYLHEIPGGQLTNLMFQARELGLSNQWKETKAAFMAANLLLGDIIKATPTSKAVADLAQFMVNSNLSQEDVLTRAGSLDFPDSVLDYFEGLMGQPFDGFPEPFRTQVLARAGRKKIEGQASARLPPVDLENVKRKLTTKYGDSITETDVCSYVMFPDVFTEYRTYLARYGDISSLPSQQVLAPPKIGEELECPTPSGRLVRVKVVAVQPLAESEEVSPDRTVFFRVDGKHRQAIVRDLSVQIGSKRRQADPSISSQMGSPFSGIVSTVLKEEGSQVSQGDVILSISAMKMIINVSAPSDGFLRNLDVEAGASVEKGDLLFEILGS